MCRQPVLHLFLAAVAWAGFVGVLVWTVLFLAGGVVSPVVDGPSHTDPAVAVITDLGLLLLFAAQHSVMARTRVKVFLRRRIAPELERTTYVLAIEVCLILLLMLWQPFGGEVWDVEGPAWFILWSLYGAGWLLAIAATIHSKPRRGAHGFQRLPAAPVYRSLVAAQSAAPMSYRASWHPRLEAAPGPAQTPAGSPRRPRPRDPLRTRTPCTHDESGAPHLPRILRASATACRHGAT